MNPWLAYALGWLSSVVVSLAAVALLFLGDHRRFRTVDRPMDPREGGW